MLQSERKSAHIIQKSRSQNNRKKKYVTPLLVHMALNLAQTQNKYQQVNVMLTFLKPEDFVQVPSYKTTNCLLLSLDLPRRMLENRQPYCPNYFFHFLLKLY